MFRREKKEQAITLSALMSGLRFPFSIGSKSLRRLQKSFSCQVLMPPAAPSPAASHQLGQALLFFVNTDTPWFLIVSVSRGFGFPPPSRGDAHADSTKRGSRDRCYVAQNFRPHRHLLMCTLSDTDENGKRFCMFCPSARRCSVTALEDT
ncbi:hypothetical protein PoB_004781100 [Plakobranchus ocellatus]|uniref:Uncharacterized protein n=1 Tax=Plakobranchus ocellatus TaxID=259542 RepID=A0AAV4BLL3_9GAST|nr:hypothetical protein PoB_004781100 [Plakobranchus ocellatus]